MMSTMKSTTSWYSSSRRSEHDESLYGTLWVLVACLGALATLFLPGCSGSSQAHAVNEPRAREALKTALDHWKNGEDIKALQSSATPMTVQDFEWSSGAKLIRYELVDDGKAYDANLRVRVKLILNDSGKGKGKTTEKTVWYLVGTSPSVTVFRDMLRR
jgi:hypothetical protein